MAGNKALKKFSESKIPKQGYGKPNKKITIYTEPNTQSKVIGTIQKGTEVYWISKSICDDREWLRCNKDNNFGYIIVHEANDECNFDESTIKETETKKNTEKIFKHIPPEINTLTKEEIDYGNDALKEILNEPNIKNNNNNNFDISYDTKDNSSDETFDNINDIDYFNIEDDMNFNIINEIVIKTESDLENEILKEIKIGKNEDKKEKENTFKRIVETIKEIIPEENNDIDKYLLNNKDLSSEEKFNGLLKMIPGLNPKENNNKISTEIKASKYISNNKDEKPKKNDNKGNKNKKSDEKPDENNKKRIEYEIIINGKKIINYAPEEANFIQALRALKRYYRIPMGNQPINTKKHEKINIKDGKPRVGQILKYKDIDNNVVTVRVDCFGHKYDDGTELPPHINGPDKKHFFFSESEKNLARLNMLDFYNFKNN